MTFDTDTVKVRSLHGKSPFVVIVDVATGPSERPDSPPDQLDRQIVQPARLNELSDPAPDASRYRHTITRTMLTFGRLCPQPLGPKKP